MKKSLIALAAVAASGAAFAQSSVTLFGTVDANVSVVDGKSTTTSMGNSGLSSSAIGFRGVEDLGNGLKAGFHLEAGINNDTGDGNTAQHKTGGTGLEFGRRSTLSLMGGFGEVRLGRDTTPTYTAASKYDVFGAVGIGGSRMWNSQSDGFNNVRRSNMISFYSQNYGGFKLNANYAFGENVATSTAPGNRMGDTAGIAALYDNGPLSLALAYQHTGRTEVGGQEEKFWVVGGSYDFGVAKLSLAYNDTSRKDVAGEGTDNVDGKNYLVGVSAKVGAAGTVKASYNRYQRDYNNGTADRKANHFSLGYVHDLSKRTAVYGTYSYLKNKNNQTGLAFGGAGVAGLTPDNNGKLQGVQIGVRHNF